MSIGSGTMQPMAQIQSGVEAAEKTQNHAVLYQAAFSILFTAFMVWAVYFLINPGTLPIRQVRVEGAFSHLSGDKLHVLVSNAVRGNFFHLDVTAVRNALLAEPWVKDVTVQRVWPDSIRVFVTEQVAVARWNENGLLNRSGQYFAPDKNTFPDNLPLLEGPEGTQTMILEKYFFLEKLLQPHDLPVVVLRLDERRAWLIEFHNRLQVELGREDFEERAARFEKFVVADLGPRIADAIKIDMRYPNGYAVRWKPDVAEAPTSTGAL